MSLTRTVPLLLAACTGAATFDPGADEDTSASVDTDTKPGPDTDTDPAPDTDTGPPCPMPSVDQVVELGGRRSLWSVVDEGSNWGTLTDNEPTVVSDLVPGQTIGFRLTLPGTLTFLRPADLDVVAQASDEDRGNRLAAAPAVATYAFSDMPGVTLSGEANNEWTLRDPKGDDGYFYGTFVFAEDVPAGTEATCFGWLYKVPRRADGGEGGTVTVAHVLEMTIHRLELQVSATGGDASAAFTWTPGG